MNIPNNGEIVIDYLNKFPETSSLALARKIHSENSGSFNSVDHARQIVRYYRGSQGKSNRKATEKKYSFPNPGAVLPESDDVEYEPFIIPDTLGKGIVLSDIHIPYHSVPAIELTLEFAYKQGVDFFLLNGDIIDFYQLSRWVRDPRKRDVKGEIKMLQDFIRYLTTNFPKAKIYYKFGNHEERWDIYMMQHAAELYSLDKFHLENVLDLEAQGVIPIKTKRVVKYRHLAVIHGHEYRFNISNPVNPARGIFLRTHDSALAGHFHQTSEHSESTLSGEITACWSVGCLCGLHPEYMPLNKWNHGFAMLRGMEDKYWRVDNKKIIEGRIV